MFNNAEYIKRMDLSQRTDLGRMYDFCQSFEVGEHIYTKYEDNFIDNIAMHARVGVVLSWGVLGQEGFLHINTHDNYYLIGKMAERGFRYHSEYSNKFRGQFRDHFARSLMVFIKN